MSGQGRPWTDDDHAAALALLDDGASYSEVARTLGRHKGNVLRHFPGRGWKPGRPSGQHTWGNYK